MTSQVVLFSNKAHIRWCLLGLFIVYIILPFFLPQKSIGLYPKEDPVQPWMPCCFERGNVNISDHHWKAILD